MNLWWQTLLTLFSHWRRHPVQLATWAVGLLLATALWSGVQALNSQARDSYDRAASVFGGADVSSYQPRDGESVSQQAFTDLRRQGRAVSPVLEGQISIDSQNWSLIGVDPVTLPEQASAAGTDALSGDGLTAFLTTPGRTLVSEDTRRELEADIGDQLLTDDGRRLPPMTEVEGLPPGTLMVDIGFAQPLLDQPDRLTRLLIADDPSIALPERWAEALRLVEVEPEGDLARLTDSFHLNLTALGLLAFLVGLFIVHGATGLAFEQRRGVLRTLRSCGVSARVVFLALVSELVLLALVAGSAGLLLGYVIAAALLPDVAASLGGLYGASVSGTLTLAPSWWLSGLGMSLAGALLAAASSLWHTARLPVLALARPQAWHASQQKTLRWQVRFGGGLLTVALALLMWGSGLVMGFLLISGLLLGTALCLPAVLSVGLSVGERWANKPVWQWFWADARQQLSGLSLALMALLLALSANIGVGGMVESFRQTFTGWLDQRLAAEVYLNAGDEVRAADMADWLQERPDVTAVLTTAQVSARLDDWPVEINGVQDHATYRDHWPVITQTDDAWDRLASGEGVMVSEQLARRQGISLGDVMSLPEAEPAHEVSVVGIYSDYGNPRGQLLTDIEWLEHHYGARVGGRGFSVRIPEQRAGDLVLAAREQFNLSSGEAVDQASVKTFASAVFERTFVATGALNTLTLGIAGVALFTSLLTLSNSRLAQLAPLWAQGVPRRQLARLEWLRTLLLALLTALIAVPLGLALAWCLVAVINVEAFGWRLPLYFYPQQWLILVAMAVVTAGLACIWPLWQLSRRSVAAWTRVFAHEQ